LYLLFLDEKIKIVNFIKYLNHRGLKIRKSSFDVFESKDNKEEYFICKYCGGKAVIEGT